MSCQSDFKIGDQVCYEPEHYNGKFKNATVKDIPFVTDQYIRVLFEQESQSKLLPVECFTKGWRKN